MPKNGLTWTSWKKNTWGYCSCYYPKPGGYEHWKGPMKEAGIAVEAPLGGNVDSTFGYSKNNVPWSGHDDTSFFSMVNCRNVIIFKTGLILNP